MPNLPHLKFLNLSVAQVFQLLRYKASQLCDKTSQLKTEELRVFSLGLVEYANKQWRQGVFATQDWNLFNINVMMVPATNNGNEVWRGRAGVGLAQSNVNVYGFLPSLFAFQNHSGVSKYIYNGRYYLKSMLN